MPCFRFLPDWSRTPSTLENPYCLCWCRPCNGASKKRPDQTSCTPRGTHSIGKPYAYLRSACWSSWPPSAPSSGQNQSLPILTHPAVSWTVLKRFYTSTYNNFRKGCQAVDNLAPFPIKKKHLVVWAKTLYPWWTLTVQTFDHIRWYHDI